MGLEQEHFQWAGSLYTLHQILGRYSAVVCSITGRINELCLLDLLATFLAIRVPIYILQPPGDFRVSGAQDLLGGYDLLQANLWNNVKVYFN